MNDDILRQMTRALSEEYDGATAVPEATRARVIRTLAERRPRRRKWFSVGIPLFVVLGGSTAWAAATGQLDRIVAAVRVIQWQPEDVAPPAEVTHAKKLAGTGHWRPEPPIDSIEPAVVPDAEPDNPKQEGSALVPSRPVAVNAKPHKKDEAQPSTGKVAHGSASIESVVEEDHTNLLIFRSAHQAQFSDGDCNRAISIYERYLRLDPNGPFSLEAKYNRGVCLVRTGRHAAGRAALEPFAQGEYGDYRRSQSAEILQALSIADGAPSVPQD